MGSGKVYPSADTLYRIGCAASRLATVLGGSRGRGGGRDLAAVFKADEALWRLVAQVEPADPLEGAPHADKLRKQEANWARALGLEPQAPRPRTAKTLSGWPPNVNDAFAHVRSVAVRIHQAILAFDPDDPAKEWSWPGLYEVGLFARSAQVLLRAGYRAKVPAAAAKPTAGPKTPGVDSANPEWRRKGLATIEEAAEQVLRTKAAAVDGGVGKGQAKRSKGKGGRPTLSKAEQKRRKELYSKMGTCQGWASGVRWAPAAV